MRIPCQTAAPRRRAQPVSVALVTAALTAAVVWGLCDGRASLDGWLRRRGHHTIEHQTPTWRALVQVAERWLTDAPAPHIDIEIGFKNVDKLRQMQLEALRKGRIDAASKETVPATVVVGNARSKVKLRLKGDQIDHVSGRRVSFRVQVVRSAGGDGHEEPPVLGLRTFSLQAPETKGYHLEALFHASVRQAGVMAPRYEFVRVTCNGDDFGVMALEEHCAKEMLERQGRRESAVVGFEEDQMFAAQARLRSTDARDVALDDYRTAPVRVLTGDQLPTAGHALSLLRAFVAGALTPAEVFDVEALASYLAVCELWGAWHPLRWHNLRFYYDPITGRLAPIGFDGNLQMRRPNGQVVTPLEPIVAEMLRDEAVFKAFRARLATLCAATRSGALTTALAKAEAAALPILQSDFLLLQPIAVDELRQRAEFLDSLQDGTFQTVPADTDLAPLLVSALGEDRFELRNVAPRPALLMGARWRRADGSTVPAVLSTDQDLPLILAARPRIGPIPDLCLRVVPPADAGAATLEVGARLDSVPLIHWIAALPQPEAARAPSIPQTDLQTLLRRHPWLQLQEDGTTLRVAPGTHQVTETVVTPPGHRLVAGPGTRLSFAADAALVVQAEVIFDGCADAPVELVATANRWLGVMVMVQRAAQASTWRHVCVRDTTGVVVGAVEVTGGVTFVGGTIELEDVLVSGTTAEDALNVVHASVAIRRLAIERTRSDGLDGDFVRGVVSDSSFTDIGGDAIDVSGSSLHIDDCRVRVARDKALSVGEGSNVEAVGLIADHVGVGAACKDGSGLLLRDSRIVAPTHAGVMSYVKKPEYGGCSTTLTNVVVEGTAPAVRVQHGCAAQRDGVAIATEAIDVGQLYSTIMRK